MSKSSRKSREEKLSRMNSELKAAVKLKVSENPLRGGITPTQKSFSELILGRKVPTLPSIPLPSIAVLPNIPTSQPQIKTEPEPAPVKTEQQIVNDAMSKSDKQKENILASALENKKYYLQQQAATSQVWFKNTKHEYQYSEFVMITPEMAKDMLDNLWNKDEGNREKKPLLIEAYKRDISNDHWIPTDEAIGINLSKEVYNGQHRLWAIHDSGKSMPMYITWNVLDEAKFFVDTGAIRNISEKLRMVIDPMLGNRTSGFCKAIMRGLNPKVKFTGADIAEFATKYQNLINWVAKHYPIGRAEVQAVLAKAYLWYGPELIEPFCDRLRNIRFTENDPARALYVSLQASKKNSNNTVLVSYRKALNAIDALINNKSLNRVFEKNVDIFEWLPGWEIPDNKA